MEPESEEKHPLVRLRRCKSVTRAEEIVKHDELVRKSQPDKPIHRPRDSLFSWTSEFTDYTGFINWGFLLLTVGGIRLLLENFIKYGIRIDPYQWVLVFTGSAERGNGCPAFWLMTCSIVPVALCYVIELGLANESVSNRSGMLIHILNLVVIVLLPMVSIHVFTFSLVGAVSVCFLHCVIFLKLWSYVQVNLWCREGIAEKKSHRRRQSMSVSMQGKCTPLHLQSGDDDGMVHYPNNLAVTDLAYFLFAPTLCYELNFPRTSRIRKRFLLKRSLEVIIGFQVMVALMQQWIIPSVKNSLIPFSNMDVTKATERLLKLAIPNHLVWLIWFYLFFHSFLNMMGEIMHFADRNFYSDWWNANTIDTFWRSWNMPTHRWALRHLYLPLIEAGYSRNVAVISVFFLSAFFHEYLISVPLKTFKFWVFMMMMYQVPLTYVSRYMVNEFGPRTGNSIVWAALILGQPLCIMIYYHDYVITHFGETLLQSFAQV